MKYGTKNLFGSVFVRRAGLMSEKWVVIHEYDLKQGLCFMAKKDAGKGEVALFDSMKEAQDWVAAGEDIEEGMWKINYFRISV
jgi:hypothetical protein